MSNGIGRVWAVNAENGDEGRPNGVGPVWIENADQLGSKLPEPESGDAGKVLGVLNSDGDIGWVIDQSGTFTQVQADWDQTDSSQVSYIANKPSLATVATSGAYADLSGKPTIPTVDQNYNASSTNAQSGTAVASAISNKQDTISDLETIRSGASAGATAVQPSSLATVATTGDYSDLLNKPSIPAAQVNSDWDAVSGVSQILNKPSLATVATTGSYSDLTGTPTLATVATSGDYADLTNKPSIPAAQVNSDWNASTGVAQILNKPSLATVATSGSYNDLSDKPTIPPGVVVDQTYDASSTNAQSGVAVASAISNKQDTISDLETIRNGAAAGATAVQPSSLATVATTGSYTDLLDKPSIPAAQVNSDWNASSGVAQILNKPSLATVATSGSYSDLSNTPTIPTVDQTYNSASTNAQSGTAVAQAIAAIPSVSYTAGDGINISAQNAISAKVGGGVTIGNASSTTAVTNDLYVTPIRDGSTRLYPIFGRLTADTANALSNGSVTIKTLIDWNDRYFSTKYRPGIFVYDASWGYNKYTVMMFGTDPISGSILANTEIVYDINDVNASLSNLTIETILANPTNYVFFATPCDSNGDIEWDATYYHVTTSTATAVISTASYQGTVTVPNSIILENPVPTPTSEDSAKVLTVTDAQGNYGWSSVPSELPTVTGNAGKVLTVNSGATGVEWANVPTELPASTSADEDKVLTVNSSGTPVWAAAQGGSSYTDGTGIHIDSGNRISVNPDSTLKGVYNERGYNVTTMTNAGTNYPSYIDVHSLEELEYVLNSFPVDSSIKVSVQTGEGIYNDAVPQSADIKAYLIVSSDEYFNSFYVNPVEMSASYDTTNNRWVLDPQTVEAETPVPTHGWVPVGTPSGTLRYVSFAFGTSESSLTPSTVARKDTLISETIAINYPGFTDPMKIGVATPLPAPAVGDTDKVLMVSPSLKAEWATLALGSVTSIQQVNALPANPDANTLYLIPEA